MSVLKKVSAAEAYQLWTAGEAELIDIRETDEYARTHIPGSRSLPLSELNADGSPLTSSKTPLFLCRSGNRTEINAERLKGAGGEALIMEGGLEAWRGQSLPIKTNSKAPLEIMRQVQITAGTLVLAGVVLGTTLHPGFYGVSAFVGAGLTFAGISGWCGMAKALALLPWNRQPAA